jgi:outer membrane protein OmpA-like peptidoglycan-associated protein
MPAIAASALALCLVAPPSLAALSEQGGTGVWEVQSAESSRPARLELGFFSTYQRLGLRDSSDSQLNELIGGATAAFGLPGGFEISGSVPFYNPYTTFGGGGAAVPDGSEFEPKLGDVTARLRWTGPFLMPGLRWGFEGSTVFATGNNDVLTYPGRAPTQTFTVRENSYAGRAMMTWDGLRAGTGMPLRLHGNGGYTVQSDDTRYILPMGPLPLEVPAPTRNRDNDFLTLGAAAELDLPRMTLFGEVVTDQFVNDRTSLKGKESRVVVTPGVRFWLPGGVSLGGAYSFNISDDDPATAFDPGRAFPKEQWRVAISLGTVYRGASAKAEDMIAAETAVLPIRAIVPTPATARADSLAAAKARTEREILMRRAVQEEVAKVTAETLAAPAPAAVAPAPGKVAPRAAAPVVPNPLLDTDGDGIPDATDHCPLQPEDWDGFQDLDGCPDLDNDQDGIPDVRDQCPNDPETFNGYYDFDGCPDEVQARWIGPTGASIEPDPSKRSAKPDSSARTGAVAPRDSAAPIQRPAPQAAVQPVPTMLQQAPPPAAPALALRNPASDSLRAALEVEKTRARMLEERAARAEADRATLLARVLEPSPAPVAAAPALSDSMIARASAQELRQMILADRARNAETLQRLQMLEARQEVLRERPAAAAAAPTQTPASGATTVVTPRADGSADLAARLAVLESRVARENAAPPATPVAAPVPVPVPAVRETIVVQTPASGPSPEVVNKLNALESAVAAMGRADEAQAEARAEAQAGDAILDPLLPVGVTRVFPEIVFSTRSTGLSAAGVARVNEVAAALTGVPGAMVRIIGHTDDRGAAAVNLQLSQSRAGSFADMLFAQGVSRNQIIVEGRGEAEPLGNNATTEGRSMNRRVEFVRIR